MAFVRPKISSLVASQLPEHIRNEQPAFVAFLEAYYRYLEQNELDLKNTRDLDNTLDSYITHFKNELAQNLPYSEVDERFLLNHIKDLYLAKGSEASYDLLFKILFGKKVTIDYPSLQMLRASDGKWNQDLSIFVEIQQGDPNQIVGKLVDVITPNKIIRVLIDRRQYVEVEIERAIKVSETIYEFIIDRRFFGDINVGDRIRYRDDNEGIYFSGDILATTSDLTVQQKGTGFKVGELYEIKNFDGYGTIMKVKSVDSNGGIQSAEFIKYGIGYSTEFTSTLIPKSGIAEAATAGTSVLRVLNDLRITDRMGGFSEKGNVSFQDYIDTTSGDGEIYKVEVTAGGSGYTSAPTVTIADPSTGTTATATATISSGAVTAITITNVGSGYVYGSAPTVSISGGGGTGATADAYVDTGFGAWDGTYAGEVQREFGISTTDSLVSTETPAVISVGLGAIAYYPGYYINNDGFLDDAIYIQDSRYYQAYSYLVKIDETLESYQSAIKTLIHPAGMALFGEYDIRNEFDLSIQLESLIKILNIVATDELFATEDMVFDGGVHPYDPAVVGDTPAHAGIQKYVNDTPLANSNPNSLNYLSQSPGDDDNTFFLVDTAGSNTTRTNPDYSFSKALFNEEDDYDGNPAVHEVTLSETVEKKVFGKRFDYASGNYDGQIEGHEVVMLDTDGSNSARTNPYFDITKPLATIYSGVTELPETTMADGSSRFGLSSINMEKELADTPVMSEYLTYDLTMDVFTESFSFTDDDTFFLSKPINSTSTNYDGDVDDETVVMDDDDVFEMVKNIPQIDGVVTVTEVSQTTMANGQSRFGIAAVDSDKVLATSYSGMSDTDASSASDLNRTTPAFDFAMVIEEGASDEVTFSESGFINKNPYAEAGYFLNDGGIYVSDNYQTI
jgi:hypothetical protein